MDAPSAAGFGAVCTDLLLIIEVERLLQPGPAAEPVSHLNTGGGRCSIASQVLAESCVGWVSCHLDCCGGMAGGRS